ncbi:hypothetical protein [Flavobacterium aquariorum]|nr:hypothetical protein [Flavobacterium aquariorum]
MKNSILILGIALVSLSNVCKASNTINSQVGTYQALVSLSENDTITSNEKTAIVKPEVIMDSEIFNPETVIGFNAKTVNEIITENDKLIENTTSDEIEFIVFEDSMKDIIAQSDLIIENTVSNEAYPLSTENNIESEIAQLEMVIESSVSDEVSSLNLKEINKNTLLQNNLNKKAFVGMN